MSVPAALPEIDFSARLVRAVVLYALAEFQSGNATTLVVTADGGAFSVTDDGRGHAIHRTVDGLPYLPFIYTHLEYPYAAGVGGPVQLHGIGMSLLNALCSELSVSVRKETETLCLTYRDGRLHSEVHTENQKQGTGNTVSGRVNPRILPNNIALDNLRQWLMAVVAANRKLKLLFNGEELKAIDAGAA